MKLIKEYFDQDNIEFLLEENKETGEKDYYIRGIFMEGNIKNRNGRMYPADTLLKEVNRYNKEYVTKNRAYGELGHPDTPTVNLDRVSHMIKELTPDGNNIIGKAKIVDTPNGNIVKSLMKEGASLGVSSRGMGTLRPDKTGVNIVQSDFRLASAADIVADPSAPNAFVEGIMENVEWVYDDRRGWIAEEIKKEIKRTSIKKINEMKLAWFEKYLDSL